jgi:hypothetical protein
MKDLKCDRSDKAKADPSLSAQDDSKMIQIVSSD